MEEHPKVYTLHIHLLTTSGSIPQYTTSIHLTFGIQFDLTLVLLGT